MAEAEKEHTMQARQDQQAFRRWLTEIWSTARSLAVLRGGEDGPAVQLRELIAVIDDPSILHQVREWTTSGDYKGDVCRCPGDLTLALHGPDGAMLGSATVHTDRI